MKKILLSAAAVAMMLSACQEEAFDTYSSSDEVVVSLNASTPEAIAMTRSGEDETNSAKGALTNVDWTSYDLRYVLEIWDAKGENQVKARMTEVKGEPQDATFDIRITPGHEYKFVLWADVINADGKSHYNIDTLKKIKVDDHACINDEAHDAYTLVKNITVTADMKETLTLTRPFGKIRVVTTDINDLKLNTEPQAVKVVYNATRPAIYNAFTGEVEGALTTVEHTAVLAKNTYLAGHDATDGNQTLFVDYILATNEQAPVQFELTAYEDEDMTKVIRTYDFDTDIPVQRNYLTTIMGNVLTTATEFTITIDEAFANGDDLYQAGDVMPWDGTTIVAPAYDATTKTYTVYSADELAWFQNNAVSRVSINIEENIDFGKHNIKPLQIGYGTTINGNNHSISNFTIVNEDIATLFESNISQKVNDLTIANATIEATDNDGDGTAYAGAFFARTYGTCVYTNCVVRNVEVKGLNKVGAFGGFVAENQISATNCKVTNSTVTNFTSGDEAGQAAGFIGYINAEGDCVFTNCTVENSAINVTKSRADRHCGAFIGTIDGAATHTITIEGCNIGNNVTLAVAGKVQSTGSYGGFVGGGRDNVVPQVVVIINTAEQFTTLAGKNMVSPSDFTVKLGGDIDLQGADFSGMALYSNGETSDFTFDGQGHTIKNLVLQPTTQSNGGFGVCHALFSSVGNQEYTSAITTIKDFTIENVKFAYEEAEWSSAIVGYCQSRTIISDVNVKNADFSGFANIAGLVGMVTKGVTLDATNCSVENITAVAKEKCAAGLIGTVVGIANLTNCTVSGTNSFTAIDEPEMVDERVSRNLGTVNEL